jgi:RimJ/RimL family protein N-acetyltransferase
MKASYQLGNQASRRILLGLGFRETGTGTSFCRATNAQTDIMNLTLAAADWQAARERRR